VVRAVVEIDEWALRVLNVIKAKHGFKDKSQVISLIVHQFEEVILEPE
jgi:hypothetical protein